MKKIIAALCVLSGAVAPAYAQDEATGNAKSGFRVEGRLLYETPTVSDVGGDDEVYKIGSGVGFGAETGYDFKVGSEVVVGPYVTFDKSTVENCAAGDCLKVKDNLAAGLHLGYALSENSQLYAKVGYSKLRLELTSGGTVVDRASGAGVQGALGYEYSFGKSLYGRLELGYADNGKIDGINVQRRHVGIGLGARF